MFTTTDATGARGAGTMKIGQRVSYTRRNEVRHGTIVGIDTGSIAGTYYWVRNDASQLRHAVLPQHIINR